MADVKISALPAASTPLTGAEVLPIVQSSVTTKVAVSNLTAGLAGTASININGTVGATTPAAGAFTTVSASGATTLSSTLGVTGAATLSSTLGVTGATTLSSTLGVTGVASFADLIDASGAAAGQLKFPAAQNASSNANTLDDYEEGVWTPTIISSGGGAPTYISQTGRYIKIGKQVFASAVIDLATAGTLAAGTLSVGGFPFTVNNSLASRATGTCSWANFSTSFINVLLRMAENTTTAEVIGATAAVATNSSVSQANFGATGGLRFGITYEASA